MTHSEACVDLVAQFEGLRLAAYRDIKNVWTLGFGHTYNVGPGDTCTIAQAKAWLFTDLMVADHGVNQALKVPVTQYEFDACVSLAYNIGVHAFGASTLARKLNAGDIAGAAAQFLLWVNAGPQMSEGLTRRRKAEMAMFLTPAPPEEIEEPATEAPTKEAFDAAVEKSELV